MRQKGRLVVLVGGDLDKKKHSWQSTQEGQKQVIFGGGGSPIVLMNYCAFRHERLSGMMRRSGGRGRGCDSQEWRHAHMYGEAYGVVVGHLRWGGTRAADDITLTELSGAKRVWSAVLQGIQTYLFSRVIFI